MKTIGLFFLLSYAAYAQCGKTVINPITRRIDCIGPETGATGPTGPTGPAGPGAVHTTVTFSATPTFTISTSATQLFTITLTGNVTSSTLTTTSATDGQDVTFELCQDGTGSRTFAWPSNVSGGGVINSQLSRCSRQTFRWNGSTNAVAVAPMTCPTCGSLGGEIPSNAATATLAATATALAANGTNCLANSFPLGVDASGNSESCTAGATIASTNTFTGRQDAGGAASTAPAKVGTSLPGTCTVGDLYFKSDATAGQNIYECQSTNTWTQQLNSGSGGSDTSIFSSGTVVQRKVQCAYGTVSYTALTAAATSQEITIQTGMAGNTRYEQITFSETTQFAGVTGGIQYSVGRPGTSTHAELTAVPVLLGVSSGDSSYLNDRPIPPQLTSTYSLVVNFSAVDGTHNVNTASAGVWTWELCAYSAR